MPKTINARVEAVTMSNQDGTLRQDIIAKCKEGDYLSMEVDYQHRRKGTIALLTASGERIGSIDPSIGKPLVPFFEAKRQDIKTKIVGFTSAYGGSLIGVRIQIEIPDDIAEQISDRLPDTQNQDTHQTIRTKVVGVSRKNEDGTSRQELIMALDEGDDLAIEREYSNEFDDNAITVLTDMGEQLGYLKSELAAKLAPQLENGIIMTGKVLSITGDEDTTLGLNIEITVLNREESEAVIARQKAVADKLKAEMQANKAKEASKIPVIEKNTMPKKAKEKKPYKGSAIETIGGLLLLAFGYWMFSVAFARNDTGYIATGLCLTLGSLAGGLFLLRYPLKLLIGFIKKTYEKFSSKQNR